MGEWRRKRRGCGRSGGGIGQVHREVKRKGKKLILAHNSPN
jgi:hypothetical protein